MTENEPKEQYFGYMDWCGCSFIVGIDEGDEEAHTLEDLARVTGCKDESVLVKALEDLKSRGILDIKYDETNRISFVDLTEKGWKSYVNYI